MIPEHDLLGVLREVAGARRVLRTRYGGVACVTRVLLGARVEPTLGPLVEQAARFGRGSLAGVPEELYLTLEGYRVSARLPHPDPRWPDVLAAGVTDEGHVYVTTRWIEGVPLSQLGRGLPEAAVRDLGIGVLEVVAALHRHHIAHGDLKPENLVRTPEGGVAVIDLDTLREVGGPTIPAVTRDLTRTWAAPEQERQQRTYLASDVWAWARLVAEIGAEPGDWAEAIAACRLYDPLRRPRTEALLAYVERGGPLVDWLDRATPPTGPTTPVVPEVIVGAGGPPAPPDTSTERVPETIRTERVPETTSGPRTPPATPPRPTPPPVARRRWGCLHWTALAFVTPLALCVGGGLWWDRQNVVEANRRAEETLAALKAHKVRRELNSASQRAAIRAMADEAWDVRHTPRSSAVRALATVWAQGWQDAGRAWDPDRYAEGLAAVEDVEDSHQPEALLARGTLYAAACRLHRGDATTAADCDRALDTLGTFQKRLPDAAEYHWMRVEGAWTEVLVRTEIATQELDADLPDATAVLETALKRCDDAGPWLAWAPVNGPELVQDCLRVAGLAGDVPRWLDFAERLVAPDAPDGLDRATVVHLYTSGGRGCDDTTVEKRRGEWVAHGRPWCVALGHAARRCWASAARAAAQRDEEPTRPWEALDSRIASADGDWSCVR